MGTYDFPPHFQDPRIRGNHVFRTEDSKKKTTEEMLGTLNINAILEEESEEGSASGICPFEPVSVLNNWTAEEMPEVFRAFPE